ncbi:hypothetical protein RhiirB3_452236 [Rhizophagus irregularis]|nr:hypothetical protein RhiirB3_452236 [Rhizophagus irregularis]
MLRAAGCTDVTPFDSNISSYKFWTKSANPVVDQGADGKCRILSIIAQEFTYHDLQEKLGKFARINGPGCTSLQKVKISRNSRLTQEMQDQFEIFFQDKANVAMSSYKMDPKTDLPILYLLDQKQTLWKRFSEIYLNGIEKNNIYGTP